YLAAGLMINGGTSLTAGTLVAFTTLQARLQMPLLQLMRVTLDVQTSLALFRRIFEYLDLVPAITEKPGATTLDGSTLNGEIEFSDVWFQYPEPRELSGTVNRDRFSNAPDGDVAWGTAVAQDLPEGAGVAGWALRGVSFKVQPGQLAAIVGPSGAGKTTMTYLVPRFYDVSEGAVLIDGHDVRDLTLGSVSEAVGMVTQEPYLFHGTIRDNIAYAKPDATAAEIEQAARDANIHDRILGFADGYETITGERGYRLSGGEKQRLAIARVLLMDPRILILDEATSALDTETERLVQEALERATHNRTTIAIAHRLSTIRSADVIFGIEDGVLVEQGSHEDLLEAGGLYARLYIEQFGSGQIEARFTDGVRFADGSLMCERNDDERRADVSF
ncbi:MAG: ABC transporter ATP-binding protein, partial [Aeromicrobium sp.]